MCGGSTNVSFPGPTPQEIELEQAQLDALNEQKNTIEGFKPFVLQQMGLQSAATGSQKDAYAQKKSAVDYWQGEADRLKATPDATIDGTPGSTRLYQAAQDNLAAAKKAASVYEQTYEYTPDEVARQASLKQMQTQAQQLAIAQNQRTADALAGKIGPSDALTNQENQDFAALKEDQGRLGNEIIGDDLTNATAKSTSGIQALEAMRKTYGSLKTQEINNIIAGGPGQTAQYTSNYRAAAPTNAMQAEAGLLSPLASLNGQYSSAYQPYEFQQQGQFNADSVNAQNNQSFYNTILTGLMNGASYMGGQYAGKK